MSSTATDGATPAWFLDELAFAGRENLDPGHVRHYDAKEDADADAEVALLRDWGMDRSAEVVDLGAGTGQFSVAAARFCHRVVAVDVSPLMIAQLETKVASAGLSNVEVVQAGFLSYQHQGRDADVVYSRFAMHHLPDFWKAMALHRIRAMVRPGGLFRLWDVVYDFDLAHAPVRLDAWCDSVTGTAVDEWSRRDVEEHVRDEFSTFSWILEPMLEQAGFEVLSAEHSDDGIFAKYLLKAT